MEENQEHQDILSDEFTIEVELMQDGKLPTRGTDRSAGFDVYATSDITLQQGVITKHPLNIKLCLPKNTYASIETKSGLGSKGMLVYAGVIDEDYRGVPHVICTNLSKNDITILKGQKIAQMIMRPFSLEYKIKPVLFVDENTQRGAGGFGSTGR